MSARKPEELLNKRSELVSKYRHANYKISTKYRHNYKANYFNIPVGYMQVKL